MYGTRFGVCLSGAYKCAMEMHDLDCDDAFMDWFVSLTHVLACTLQLMCCLRVSPCSQSRCVHGQQKKALTLAFLPRTRR